MASTPTFQSNPYADFDLSQWSNPYSPFPNSPIPPASYAGWPTDAHGNPIQPQPGMTLNSSPAQPAAAPAATAGTGGYVNPALRAGANADALQALSSLTSTGGGNFAAGPGTPQGFWQQAGQNQQAAPAAAAPAASTPLQVGNPLTAQQYLQLRANPGRVTTPGATVPIAQGTQPNNSVLQQFLANWKPAQSGPGSGFQQALAQSLKGS